MDDIWNGEPVVLDGKYRIDAPLGEGGMGAVYRATHLGTTRTVAIKVIHPRFSRDPEFVGRFRRKAEAAGLVSALLQFALPLLVWILSIDSHFVLRFDDTWQPREAGFSFGMSAGSMLFQLLNIVVTPLTAIMTAQLYLKARHAGGEATGTP